MMRMARRKDVKMKYGKYTPIELYIKSYAFATVVVIVAFCIGSCIQYGIDTLDTIFFAILIICSLMLSLIGMVFTMVIEWLKNYLIKVIIK